MGQLQQTIKEEVDALGTNGSQAHESETGEQLSRDEIFDLLRNSRRREVLRYLDALDDGNSTLSELAEYIAGVENDIKPNEVGASQRKRVYIGLYQGHLPKLADKGAVEYNQARGTVKLGDISQLEPYLFDSSREPQSRGPVYGAVAIAAVVVVGLLGLVSVPMAWLAVLSTAALLVLAVYHCYR